MGANSIYKDKGKQALGVGKKTEGSVISLLCFWIFYYTYVVVFVIHSGGLCVMLDGLLIDLDW